MVSEMLTFGDLRVGRSQRTMPKMRRLLAFVVLTVGLALAAACGGGGTKQPSSSVTPAATAPGAGGPPPVSATPTVTANGLQIIDVKVGTGDEAQNGKRVTVHYTGWLADGTKFDSSLDRGQPIGFVVGSGQLIPGFDQGVVGMKVGGTRRLIIPPDLAYGAQGRPPTIPPSAQLTFDIQLLSVQ